MNTDNTYCRLCAESKHRQKQVDLDTNPEKRLETLEKLYRINAPTEFIDSKLPSTVCLDCIRSLDKCFSFVVAIESAQNILSEIFLKQDVKTEYHSDDDQSIGIEHEEELSVEIKAVKTEGECKLERKVNSTSQKKVKKIIKSASLDSIPLSQLKENWADYNWQCVYCDVQFLNIEDLQTHMTAVHNVCNSYRCTDCTVRKRRLDRFLIHVQTHHKALRYSCYKCFEKFRTIAAMRKHRQTHLETEHNCTGCNMGFKSSTELNQHRDVYYKESKKIDVPQISYDGTRCLICSKTFTSKGNVKLHILRMHTERQQTHVCEVCGKAFYDKHNHAEHMLHVHTDYRPYKCHICHLGFKTPKSLKDHTGRHYNEKPLACEKCGKHFRLKKHLAKHSVIHTDQLPFQCSFCDKRFQRKQYLSNHLLQHTGERPYSCLPCQQHFTGWGNYNKHMICRHNQDTARKKAVLVDELSSSSLQPEKSLLQDMGLPQSAIAGLPIVTTPQPTLDEL